MEPQCKLLLKPLKLGVPIKEIKLEVSVITVFLPEDKSIQSLVTEKVYTLLGWPKPQLQLLQECKISITEMQTAKKGKGRISKDQRQWVYNKQCGIVILLLSRCAATIIPGANFQSWQRLKYPPTPHPRGTAEHLHLSLAKIFVREALS